MKPYYEQDGITIYHGEACAKIASLPDGAAELLLTDPPYSSGGAFRGDRLADPLVKYINADSENQGLPTFTGDTRDQLGFLFWVAAWLHGSLRVISPGGIAAFFSDWRQLPAAILALQSGGYVWRGIVPWHKRNARPVRGRWANACEYVAWGTNGPRSLDVCGPHAFPGWLSCTVPSDRQHATQKPVEILRDLLGIIPQGATVLDPFMGSGSTLVAAKETDHRAIGIEIEERYCEIAARRLDQMVLPLETAR